MLSVGAEMEFSRRREILAFLLPCLVVTNITPLAPRAPYNAVAVASFMMEEAGDIIWLQTCEIGCSEFNAIYKNERAGVISKR